VSVDAIDGPVRPIQLDVNGFFEHMAGSRALSRDDVDALLPRVAAAVKGLGERRKAGDLPFYRLPYDHEGIHTVGELADELRERFETLVVLGIGGSALGTKAAIEGAVATAAGRGGMRVEVLDNVDPAPISRLLGELDLSRTAFNVISKSGQTAETMAQFLLVRDRLLRELGDREYRDHIVVTTDAVQGTLRKIAVDEGFRTLPVPEGVGGRFSVLSAVGLLPIAAAGLDVERLCAGARAMDVRTSLVDVWHNPAALHAALLYLAYTERATNIHVFMPYSDGLLRLAEWYGQLWAESLGKRYALDGTKVEVGQTPVRALGATDQHSQVQLYMEGPYDKVVTFVRVEEHSGDLEIPAAYGDVDGVTYLCGHTLGQLLNMEQRATELALAEAGRLASVIVVPRADESAIGQLFHLLEVQTLVMGALLGVDPLDQPGVEAGKKITYALAGRPGYEALAGKVREQTANKQDRLVLS